MALWDSFLNTIGSAGKKAISAVTEGFGITGGTASLGQSVLQAGTSIGTSQIMKGTAAAASPQTEEELRKTIQDKLKENKQFDVTLASKSNDLILKTAIAANEKFISPYVTRPISTLGLLTDTNSPLYKSTEFEPGFQVSDIKRAYERSEFVSPMQSLTKSNLIPLVGDVSSVVLKAGGIDTSKINLWSDESIKKNFSDNMVGRWYTGGGDFILANAALAKIGKLANMGAKAAVEAAGFQTSKTVAEIETLARDGFKHMDTNGAEGSFQTISAQMQELADTKNIATISDIVSKYTTNARIIPALRDVSTKEAALDIILADKGNIDAIVRLTKTNADHLFEIADVSGQIKARNILTGEFYQPKGPAVERIRTAWEQAIARDERFAELRKAFLDDEYDLTVGGVVDYIPGTPKFFAEPYAKAGAFTRKTLGEAAYRNFDDFADVVELKFGTRAGGVMVYTLKIASRGAGYKPIGLVTNSGMRPMDARIELNAFLDDIKLLREGNVEIEILPGKKELVSNLRKAYEARVVNAKTDAELTAALEDIDKSLGRIIAYSNGYYDDAAIDAYYASFRANMRNQSDAFQKNGYSVNYDGSIDAAGGAKTLRQFTESYQFTPWNHMEREFEKIKASNFEAGTQLTGTVLKSFYEDLTRIWTFDVLARPMFIVKQSIVEPLVSVGLAAGADLAMEAAKTVIGRTAYLGWNKIATQAALVLNRNEFLAVNQAVKTLSTSTQKAMAIRDMLTTELEEMLSKGSPAIKEQYLPIVQKELKAAERLVDELEGELHAAANPFGKLGTMPNAVSLQRRIKWLEENTTSAEKARMASRIANAKAALGQYKGTINSLASNVKVIQDAEAALTKAWDDIESEFDTLGLAKKVQADTFGRTAKFKKAYVGKTSQYRMVNGEWVNLDSFVNDVDGNNFVRAIKAEVGNARTTEMNFIGEMSVGTRKSILERKVPNVPINPSEDIYFEELSHIANNLFRQEIFIDKILADTPVDELIKWGLSKEGQSYFKLFGAEIEQAIRTEVNSRIALVRRMFPSVEARSTILQREVNAQELQSMLAPYAKRLYQINPTDFQYAENAIFGRRWWVNLENGLNSAASKIFRMLTTPENAIRETFFDKIALDKLAQKADYLAKQGVEMTVKQYNALRQAAGREALQEMEKTLYTVRRQNRMLYAARAAVAFPTATLNAFYRYGRLAVRNPGRSVQFLNNYQSAFKSFGVDKNGNPTDKPDEIAFLMLPGSRDIPFLKGDGDGILLNARSIGFMLNWPSPSAISGISVGTLLKTFPGTEEGVKKALGPLWETWFPYGAPTSVTKTFMPPWLNAAYNAVTGDEGKADFVASWRSVYDYHKTLVELGIEDKFPTEAQIKNEAKGLWEQKARWAFVSPFGVPIKVSTNKMDLIDNLWYTLMNKYMKQGNSYADAKTLAGDEMLQTLGPKFMVDRVSFKADASRLNIPESPEAWGIIMEKNTELVKSIADIKPGDISLVGVLTGDLRVNYEDRNTSIVNKLRDPNLKLPGTSELVNMLQKTPEEVEKLRIKNRTWKEYTALKERLMEDVPEGRTLRSYPGKQAALEYAANNEFKQKSPMWWNEYQNSRNGNAAWEYARAFQLAISNDKFMAERKTSRYWQDVQTLMTVRGVASQIYNILPDGDKRKAAILDSYNKTVEVMAGRFHPELRQLLSNYFDNDNLKAVS